MTENSYAAANWILDTVGPVRGVEYAMRMAHPHARTQRPRDWWLAVERDIRDRVELASATGELGNWQRGFEKSRGGRRAKDMEGGIEGGPVKSDTGPMAAGVAERPEAVTSGNPSDLDPQPATEHESTVFGDRVAPNEGNP